MTRQWHFAYGTLSIASTLLEDTLLETHCSCYGVFHGHVTVVDCKELCRQIGNSLLQISGGGGQQQLPGESLS